MILHFLENFACVLSEDSLSLSFRKTLFNFGFCSSYIQQSLHINARNIYYILKKDNETKSWLHDTQETGTH